MNDKEYSALETMFFSKMINLCHEELKNEPYMILEARQQGELEELKAFLNIASRIYHRNFQKAEKEAQIRRL